MTWKNKNINFNVLKIFSVRFIVYRDKQLFERENSNICIHDRKILNKSKIKALKINF